MFVWALRGEKLGTPYIAAQQRTSPVRAVTMAVRGRASSPTTDGLARVPSSFLRPEVTCFSTVSGRQW